MCPRHQFVWPAAIVNDGSSVSIITMQTLVPCSNMILGADHPDNHVIRAISRGDKGRAATAGGSVYIPTAADGRRIGCGNAKSREDRVAIVVGAERNISALFGLIGDARLKDNSAGN